MVAFKCYHLVFVKFLYVNVGYGKKIGTHYNKLHVYGNANSTQVNEGFFFHTIYYMYTGQNMEEKCFFSTSVQIQSNARDYLQMFIANGCKGDNIDFRVRLPSKL